MIYNESFPQNVWVYGTGNFARNAIEHLVSLGIKIMGVIDHRNVGSEMSTDVGDFLVMPVSDIGQKDNLSIVLGIHNPYVNLKQVVKQLETTISNSTFISPVELFSFFSHSGFNMDNFWLTTNSQTFKASSSAITNFRNILGDEQSIELYDQILQYRRRGEISEIPSALPLSEQYLADDLCCPPVKIRMIDLGACQGENLEYFIQSNREFEKSYFFEPDVKNLKVLQNRIQELNLKFVECLPLGAWSQTTTLRFAAEGNTASSLNQSGSLEIEVVAIDDFVPVDYDVNFIKMDIEGAEIEALFGMKNLINRCKPHLAISVYHKPADLWEIGSYLLETYPDQYNFYLRLYGEQTFETVLYAVPKG
jgi:FkbM family methyltransferase